MIESSDEQDLIALNKVIWLASNLLFHDGAGLCPNLDEPNASDPECPACQAVAQAQEIVLRLFEELHELRAFKRVVEQ